MRSAGLIVMATAVAALPPLPKIPPLPAHLTSAGLTVRAQTAVDRQPGNPAFGFGSIWVPSSATGVVDRVDPTSLKATARIPAPIAHTTVQNEYYDSVAVSTTAVWHASDLGNEVDRIDPRTNRVRARIFVPGRPDAIAAGPNGVYVALFHQNVVLRIDPASNAIKGRRDVGGNVMGVAYGAGAVWALSVTGPQVVKLSPSNLAVLAKTSIASTAAPPGAGYFDAWWIGAGANSVCALNQQQNLVTRIDPQTGKVAAQTPLGFGSNPFSVAADGARCWAVNAAGVFETTADGKVASSHLPPLGPSAFVGVTTGAGAAWVTAAGRNTLFRVG